MHNSRNFFYLQGSDNVMIKRICPRCRIVYEYGKSCPNSCNDIAKKESQKVYDKIQRSNSELYSSKEWVRLTGLCKDRFNGLDIYRLYKYGIYTVGKLSHHIEPVEDNERRVLDINNLIYLSIESHNEIHRIYNKSEQDKKELQEYLFSCIDRYIG